MFTRLNLKPVLTQAVDPSRFSNIEAVLDHLSGKLRLVRPALPEPKHVLPKQLVSKLRLDF